MYRLRNNLIFGSDFYNVEFYAVSAWYRKFFDTEKAVPPKIQFLYGKGGTINKFNFTTVPLVPRLVPHYRFFCRPDFVFFILNFFFFSLCMASGPKSLKA